MRKNRFTAVLALLSAVLLFGGCFNIDIQTPDGNVPAQPAGTAAIAQQPVPDAAPQPDATEAPTASAGVGTYTGSTELPYMSPEEQLSYFNIALNKIKASNVGFTKSKITATEDIVLSNTLANTLVGLVKGALLSEDATVTTVQKGESSNAVMSPYNVSYVSQLTADDIERIDVVPSSNGGYVITVYVKGETNPEATGSICSRIFEFITVDDVANVYAPKVGATVDRENIEVTFSDCFARATIDATGNVTEYETYVKGVMKLKNASIRLITTDVEVVLASTTRYTDFKY